MFCAMRRRNADDLDGLDRHVRRSAPARFAAGASGGRGDIGFEIVVSDAPRGPRAAHEAQIDARFARPRADGRRRERPFAWQAAGRQSGTVRERRRAAAGRLAPAQRGGASIGAASSAGLAASGLASGSRLGLRRDALSCGRRRAVREARRVDADEFGAHRKHVADAAAERQHSACNRSRDLDRRLVGHHRGDHLILAHNIADLDRPFDDFGLRHAFADVGHADRALAHGQASIALTSARPTRAGPGK